MNKTFKFIISIIFAILIKAIFDFLYVNYVSVYFSYELFITDFSYVKNIISYFLLIIVNIFIQPLLNKPSKPSRVVVLILYLSVVIPLLTLYGYQNASSTFILMYIISYILMILILEFSPKFRIPILDSSIIKLIMTFILIIYLYVYLYLMLTGGLSRFNLSLVNVYAVRSEYVLQNGPLMGYFIPWIANVFNMGLLVWGLFKSKRNFVLLSIFLQVLLFGMTNFKTFLFAPIIVFGVFVIFKKSSILIYSLISVIGILIAVYSGFLITGNHQWSSMLIRRQFFTPANLHIMYYDYFSQDNHPFINLSNSIFKYFIDYPYDMPVTRVISWEYFNKGFGTNVGVFGDAYSNFGLFGMLLFSVGLAVFLKIIDSFTEFLPPNLISALITLPAFSLINSALFTTLSTHGFLMCIVILLIMANFTKNDIRKE
ncbi:hypothetical protein ACQ0QQ_03370 [Lysinibacillus sphaericus]